MESSEGYILAGENSLAYVLVEQGYDVWLGNNRGNIYSEGHIKWSKEDDEYFQYSFTEMGEYDIPAMIDLVLKETRED